MKKSLTAEQRAAETEIRALIERWTKAVQAGDLDGVLNDRSEDIQMFDVPPPNEVRGIETYRNTWPPNRVRSDFGRSEGEGFEPSIRLTDG